LGVDPNQPTNIVEVPDPDVIAAVQASWQFVKKQADVLLVIDTSGSMAGDKIEQAKAAARAFVEAMPLQNQLGLVRFDSVVQPVVPLASAEGNRAQVLSQIDSIEVGGDTSLYDAIEASIKLLAETRGTDDDRIQSVVVLSEAKTPAA
jgi:Ca-activated chloride channel family protein